MLRWEVELALKGRNPKLKARCPYFNGGKFKSLRKFLALFDERVVHSFGQE